MQLSRPMVQTFLDEMRFLGERLNDPVTDLWIDRLLQVAQTTLWQRGDVHLTVGGE